MTRKSRKISFFQQKEAKKEHQQKRKQQEAERSQLPARDKRKKKSSNLDLLAMTLKFLDFDKAVLTKMCMRYKLNTKGKRPLLLRRLVHYLMKTPICPNKVRMDFSSTPHGWWTYDEKECKTICSKLGLLPKAWKELGEYVAVQGNEKLILALDLLTPLILSTRLKDAWSLDKENNEEKVNNLNKKSKFDLISLVLELYRVSDSELKSMETNTKEMEIDSSAKGGPDIKNNTLNTSNESSQNGSVASVTLINDNISHDSSIHSSGSSSNIKSTNGNENRMDNDDQKVIQEKTSGMDGRKKNKKRKRAPKQKKLKLNGNKRLKKNR